MVINSVIVYLSSILLVSGASIGNKSYQDGRIVNGTEMNIAKVPWQTSLHTEDVQFCSASIISNKWLLTAAHCTNRLNAEELYVRIGSTEKSKGGSIHQIKRIVQHKHFNALNNDYDFSLLELDDIIEFNERKQPIELMNVDDKLDDGTICLVTGWGVTLSSESTEKLRGVYVPIVNQNECNDDFDGKITPRMICAGYKKGGRDACQRDSGGPLVFYEENKRSKLVGIVSWGIGCAEPNHPGIYARVTEARQWISDETGI